MWTQVTVAMIQLGICVQDCCPGLHPPAVAPGRAGVQNLFWTARALGVDATASLAEVQEAGQRHCALPWSDLHHR